MSFRYPDSSGFRLEIDAFELRQGEVCTLAGPNGCGKTTLAKILCGLYAPEHGTIRLLPEAGAVKPDTLRTTAAYIFQNPDYQIFLPTVEEELAYGLRENRTPSAEIRRRVLEAARTFRLPELLTPPTLMSYGSRKRLQAAAYWLLDRPICILDEADSGLSIRDFEEILDLFRDEHRALLIITHNAGFARTFSDRVVLMKNGRINDEDSSRFFSGGDHD